MEHNLFIAVRFLFAKKRAMLMSLSGIVFGVGLFIATQAQTSGFENFFIRTILGTDGAIRVEDRFQGTAYVTEVTDDATGAPMTIEMNKHRKYQEGIEYPEQVKDAVAEFGEVSAMSPILRGEVTIESDYREQSGRVVGINLDEHLSVSDLENQITQGTLEDFRNNPKSVIIGAILAERLNIRAGDPVVIRFGPEGERYRTAAIFESGVEHVDKRRIFAHMPEARAILREPFTISYLQVNLYNPDRAPEVAAQMQSVTRHQVTPWQKREQVWLEVFQALRVSSALTVSTIILISGLGMFNTLAIIVMEKSKEIAILRSMGYTRSDIAHIFLWQGALVLLTGAGLGCLFGALITWTIENIPLRIRGVFSTDHFVVYWSATHYLLAVLAAAVVVMIASYIPARRAARVEPGEIIRGTSA